MTLSKSEATRPSWDEYFLNLMAEISKRATCDRGKSGCVIVRDRRIIATGYVGTPPGFPHCDEEGHLLKQVINSLIFDINLFHGHSLNISSAVSISAMVILIF